VTATWPSAEAFGPHSHRDLSAYLLAQGWRTVEVIGDRGLSMVSNRHPGFELLVPARSNISDFVRRMSQAIATLAEIEGRPAETVVDDLRLVAVDAVRLRAPNGAGITSDPYTLPLRAGVRLVEAGRDLLLAAACAVVDPRPAYHAGKVVRATQYLDTVRLGQTERGSFVVTLLSPVDPRISPQPELPSLEAEPFARQTTTTLLRALQRLRGALTQVTDQGFAAFDDAVQEGVSANLCRAVADLVESGGGIDVGVTWSRTRPGPPTVTSRAGFDAGDAPILRSAAESFEARQPEPDLTLVGYIIQAARTLEQFDGDVTLQTFVGERPRRVRTKLDEVDFATALRALRERLPISVVGDLIRRGARLELTNPTRLQVLPLDSPDASVGTEASE